MAGETGVIIHRSEHIFDRIRTAPNRVRKHSPGPNPESMRLDWRAGMDYIHECSVHGCDRKVAAKSMCLMHYKRARTANNGRERFSLLSFIEHVDRNAPVPAHRPDLGNCWEWQGARNSAGYGVMPAVRFGTHLAHRVALTLHLGRELSGVAMHLCDNPPCTRPSHLKEGTQAENMADAAAKGRARGGRHDQTHCIRGHELTEASMRRIVRADGHRERLCLECRRENSQKQSEQRKAARHERGLLRRKAI